MKRWQSKEQQNKFTIYEIWFSIIVSHCISLYSEEDTTYLALKRRKMPIPVGLQHKSDSSFAHFRFALIIFQFKRVCARAYEYAFS